MALRENPIFGLELGQFVERKEREKRRREEEKKRRKIRKKEEEKEKENKGMELYMEFLYGNGYRNCLELIGTLE